MAGKQSTIPSGLSREELARMYLQMVHTRLFEEKVAYFFSRGMVHGTTHLYVGEEAVAVGAIANLDAENWITSTHRGHGHAIAKGLALNEMMAELLGKATGYCHGKGGSMHISDIGMGHLGANGIVGGGIPIATGAGITVKLRGESRVVLCFFGDGALNQGTFHESLNMASIWNLPVVYICENNQYGMSMSRKRSINVDDLSVRAKAYGIPGATVDGNDVFAVYTAVRTAVAHAKTNGPYFLVAETYRYLGHSKSDANRYRTKEEIAEWKKKDPIARMRKLLLKEGVFSSEEMEDLDARAANDIEAAVEFAQTSPDPEPESLLTDVYAGQEEMTR